MRCVGWFCHQTLQSSLSSSNPFFKELLSSNKAVVVSPTFSKKELVLELMAAGAKW